MRLIGILLMALMLSGAVEASVYKDFEKVWEARDKTYRSERETLEVRAKSSADRAIQALVMGERTGGDDLTLALTAAWSLSELVGRGQTLYALREHMAARPSLALSEAWLQGKIDELRRKAGEADLIEGEMEILKGRDTISVQQWIGALEQLSMMRGTISGSAAELALIEQNLSSYYRARAGEQADRQRLIASVLVGLSAAVRSKQNDFQHRSAVCASTGRCTVR
ncbi:hypothetical protein [Rhizorhabdus histidinilytica]|jgi:hypothetical protein|uniref:Uncharacterized protein n=2 Tax=Rhizorhabdus histidinilytica TaxID=439228 RepID=A0A1T5C118_9SPHN|nr:hypothetical protein [Rhizorhabdus histidinilytica]QEH77343.1 hypothetical protein EIK56_03835 [Sphingomonas sp. C8-2]SKB53077.1 hypothetical protein SAMN06295920_103478 [Rhizorhabdus histidinilytica]